MDYNELIIKAEALLADIKSRWESDQVQSRITLVKDTTREMVEKYPIGTLAAALLAGFLIGKLLKDDE